MRGTRSRRSTRCPALQGTLGRGPGAAAGRAARDRRPRPAGLQGLLLRRADARRGPARQRGQRDEAAACRCCWRGGRRPRRGSTRSCCGFPVETVRDWMDDARRPGGVPFRTRGPLPAAGARARRGRRAPALAGQPVREHAPRGLRGAVHGRHQVADHHAGVRRAGAGHLRAVPGHPGDQPRAGGPRRGVHRPARDVRAERQHLCRALQRRAAARLLRVAGAALPDHARCGALRQRHPAVGGREPDRHDHDGARRAAAALRPVSQARARARALPRLRRRDPGRRVRPALRLRRGDRVGRGVGGAARRRLQSRVRGGVRRAGGSTSTRARASAAARTRRPCTACTPTCC